MPRVDSPGAVQAIARFLLEAGYTEQGLRQFGLTEFPWKDSALWPAWRRQASGDTRLATLVRLFFLGESVEAAEAHFPAGVLNGMLLCGMVRREGASLAPMCMVMHSCGMLVAGDAAPGFHSAGFENAVLAVGPATRLLALCMIPCPGSKVLDLGTGSGMLALTASRLAVSVAATDLNPRALEFAAFNAAWNGATGFTFHQGDRFAPVEGLRFDLIVSNPPFFLNPAPRMLYCDNALDLDGFVESLARGAPAHLEKGGFFQMLCEWVQIEGEPWEQRLRDWFRESGCDVHILQANGVSPAEYARKREWECAPGYPESPQEVFAGRMAYFGKRRVEAIFGGVITMRKRDGANWFVSEAMAHRPTEPAGAILRERFSTQDTLERLDDRQLLATRPRLAADVRLIRESAPHGGGWRAAGVHLERRRGLPSSLVASRALADFAGLLDGSQTLQARLEKFAKTSRAPLDTVTAEGVGFVRRLAVLGMLRFDESPAASGEATK